MTTQKDLCPINDSGNHRYFIFKVVEVFEPYTSSYLPISEGPFYQKVEYAISSCNCGSSIKQKVKNV